MILDFTDVILNIRISPQCFTFIPKNDIGVLCVNVQHNAAYMPAPLHKLTAFKLWKIKRKQLINQPGSARKLILVDDKTHHNLSCGITTANQNMS